MRTRALFHLCSIRRLPLAVALLLLMLLLAGIAISDMAALMRHSKGDATKRLLQSYWERDINDTSWTGVPSQRDCNCSQQLTASHGNIRDRPIKILSWTAFNAKTKGDEENWFRTGFETCKVYFGDDWIPCEYTWTKSKVWSSDIILFRAKMTDIDYLPKYRSPSQKWLFYDFEPPYKIWQVLNLTLIRNVFNLTSTYSRDSDIPRANYIKKCYPDAHKAMELSSLPTKNYAASKKGVVAWFVSICQSQSGRYTYVQNLQKYIQVDIYGKCGTKKCGSAILSTWKTDQCEKKLLHDEGSYKFYLAFENSLCDDYITEKLWKLDGLNIVPIVMGMADYSSMRPAGTYIDVRDYDSPKALAEYLLYLDKDDEAYNQYIRNIKTMTCRPLTNIPHHCLMCRHFQENRDKEEVVHDISKFWGMRRCRPPSEFHSFTRDDDFEIEDHHLKKPNHKG